MSQEITATELLTAGLLPGDRVYVQALYRQGGSISALTDAVEAPVLP